MKRRSLLLAALPLGVTAQHAKVENEMSRYWRERVDGFAKEPVVAGSIVFLGDSMTERFALPSLLGGATQRRLVNRGIGGDKVGGWRYWGLLDRLNAVLDLQPTQLVLMIGVNDLVFAHTPSESLHANARLLLERLAGIPQLIVQSVLPVRGNLAQHQARFAPYNAHLQAEAKRLRLHWLDLRPPFTNDDGLLRAEFASDAVHLNDAGYRLWAGQLAPLLAR